MSPVAGFLMSLDTPYGPRAFPMPCQDLPVPGFPYLQTATVASSGVQGAVPPCQFRPAGRLRLGHTGPAA